MSSLKNIVILLNYGLILTFFQMTSHGVIQDSLLNGEELAKYFLTLSSWNKTLLLLIFYRVN